MNDYCKNGNYFDDIDPRTHYPRPPFKELEESFSGSAKDMIPEPDFGVSSYKANDRLKGLVAFITGGDSGIGRAVAIAYAKEGASVAISFLKETKDSQDFKSELLEGRFDFLFIPGDIIESEHCKKAIDLCVNHFGRLDILVNNAAYVSISKNIEEIEDKEWKRHFDVNCHAVFYLIKQALHYMKPGGSIINTASISAKSPIKSLIPYSMTKSAIINFTVSLAEELISRGIRVNAVVPGSVWTPFILKGASIGQPINAGARAPIGRPAQPAELASAYVYLADPRNTYTVGCLLSVHGGFSQV